jgi:hypothetical protein
MVLEHFVPIAIGPAQCDIRVMAQYCSRMRRYSIKLPDEV